MEYRDYYGIMGLARDATQDEIKRVYRKLARKYHPDVSKEPDAEARFKELGEAYEVLKDPQKRAAYDQLGSQWKAGQEFRPPPDWDQGFEFRSGDFSAADAAQFSDFFASLFGHDIFGQDSRDARGAQRPRRGQDTRARVVIDLDDAYHGATRALTLRTTELGPDGRPQTRARTLNVRIPKGVRPGQQIRLAGQGGAGPGAPGDLYLEMVFRPHPLYRVAGRDVYLELPVAPWEAALGAQVKLPTPDGPVDLKIPPGSHAGRKLRLAGRGIPGQPPGDFYVTLQIVLPPADSAATRAAYRELEQAQAFDPRAHLGV
jgi:curved DNA-binding protein